LHDNFGIGRTEGNGFFNHYVQAVAQAGHRLQGVAAIGCGYGEDLGSEAAGEEFFEGKKERHAGKFHRQAGLQVGAGVNQGHQQGTLVARNQRGMATANVAHPANGKADGRMVCQFKIGEISHRVHEIRRFFK